MPDTLTVYGQAPGIVDVLANDLDPAGGLLVVQRAVAGDRADQLDVAIIDGRWLRISARQARPGPQHRRPSPTRSATARAPPCGARSWSPSARRPRTTPRSRPPTGSWCGPARRSTAPVLDNDVSPSGDRLTLLSDLSSTRQPGPARGRRAHRRHRRRRQGLRLRPRGALRRARAGRGARHLHRHATSRRTSTGKRADGTLKVTVVPGRRPQRPRPSRRPSRAAWSPGDTVKVRVPGSRRRPQRRPGHGHGHHLRPAAGPDRRPSAATSSSTRPIRAPSAPTSSPTPSSTPRAPSPPARSGSPSCAPGAAAAAARGRGPAHGRAGTHRDLRPARQRLHRPRRRRSRSSSSTRPDGARLDPDTNLVTVPAPDSAKAPPTVRRLPRSPTASTSPGRR